MIDLKEESRRNLIQQSKSGSEKAKNRYARRVKSRVASTVKQYNSIDMNKLFKEDILTVNINVNGETDNYIVKISFGGFLEALNKRIDPDSNDINIRDVIRALIETFNSDDVYIKCSCPDAKFRFDYWQTKKDIISGDKQNIPSNITNPDDNLGSACKHVLLVLSNTSWLLKVASVIKNYIIYARDHMQAAYKKIIYPAIYKKDYEEPIQLEIDDDELDSSSDTLDRSNAIGKSRGQFKVGNEYRYKRKEEDPDQLDIDDIQ